MTSGQTATEPRTREHEDEEVSDSTAEKHNKALAAVQRLLSVRGVRSYVVHMITLKLFGDGRPYPMGQRSRHAPELVVTGPPGWRATVTVGSRSGCYLVSIRNGPDLQTVREPHRVADLLLSARLRGRS